MALPLDVRHHQQDTFDSCGRACAQMVIGFEFARLGVLKGTALPDQTLTMANAETGILGNWATEPSELAAHIKNGLAPFPNAKVWKVVEFRPSAGSTNPNVEVAAALFHEVAHKLNKGFPSVVMVDDNDHWETAYNWAFEHIIESDTNTSFTTAILYTVDPLPVLVSPLGTPHSDIDACVKRPDTIWLFNTVSAGALVCDQGPFVGSAIGILQTKPSDWWSGGVVVDSGVDVTHPELDFRLNAWKERAAIDEFNIRDPLPPLDTNLPLIALMNFFKRDMAVMMRALAQLPEAASYSDFDWSKVVVRHAAYQKHPDRKMAIAAAPPVQGKERSILISIDQRGAVDALHVTSLAAMVKTLTSANHEPLWIIPKYSRWLPFVRTRGDGPTARYRRLYDGHEVEMPERHR